MTVVEIANKQVKCPNCKRKIGIEVNDTPEAKEYRESMNDLKEIGTDVVVQSFDILGKGVFIGSIVLAAFVILMVCLIII